MTECQDSFKKQNLSGCFVDYDARKQKIHQTQRRGLSLDTGEEKVVWTAPVKSLILPIEVVCTWGHIHIYVFKQ